VKRAELKVCGLAAVEAQFSTDPASIQRLFFDYATGRKIGAICRALAQAKKVYRCVEPAELQKVAGSIHHGGIVAIVAAKGMRAPNPAEIRTWVQRGEPLVLLDRVGNAHNLGAIARTTAFFGVPRLVISSDAATARPGDAAHRVAEGGLAHLEVMRVADLAAFARQLVAAGYEVIGAAARAGHPDTGRQVAQPVALVMGNEEHGLAPDVAAACSRLVTLPGSGKVESLNVSVAAGILIWELIVRNNRGRSTSARPHETELRKRK